MWCQVYGPVFGRFGYYTVSEPISPSAALAPFYYATRGRSAGTRYARVACICRVHSYRHFFYKFG